MNGSAYRRRQLIGVVWQASLIVMLAGLFGLGSNAIRSDGIALVGDWSLGVSSPYGEDVPIISFDEARQRFAQNSVLFVDARSDFEYREGHIAGSLNLPLDQVESRFFDVVEQLYESELIIAYCDGESCSLSHDLAVFLQDMGVTEVRVLVNGWTLWQEADLPVNRNTP